MRLSLTVLAYLHVFVCKGCWVYTYRYCYIRISVRKQRTNIRRQIICRTCDWRIIKIKIKITWFQSHFPICQTGTCINRLYTYKTLIWKQNRPINTFLRFSQSWQNSQTCIKYRLKLHSARCLNIGWLQCIRPWLFFFARSGCYF